MTIRKDIVSRLQKAEQIIPQLRQICGVPGVSIGVAFQGEVIHESHVGCRDLLTNAEPNSDTLYPIGTLAKTFTAAAIGILVHRGQLKWDTRVREVLPQFRSRDLTVSHNLTVLDLLCHRGGLARSNQWWQGAEGVLLQDKSKTIPFYSTLEPVGAFRADWAYSNWGYSILGEIIEAISGLSYGDFLRESVLEPLGLDRTTTADPVAAGGSNLAKPYGTLDDGHLHPLPQPPVHGDSIMVPAMGLSSSTSDLLRYSIALLRAHRVERTPEQGQEEDIVLRNATTHLAGHIFTSKTLTEHSYACGYYRNQLPAKVVGMGWNSLYVKKMPVLTPRGHCGPLICHGGSLPGYHSAIALLPDLDAAIVVCTNSIGLGDASGWIAMALVEAVIDTPSPNNYIQYATEAARGHVNSVPALRERLEKERAAPCSGPRELSQYIGRYVDAERDWVIDVREQESGRLEVLFQGLESQAWPLTHYENDTFLWLTERDEQAKRGRMTTYPQGNVFKLIFQASAGDGDIDRVCWPQELGLPLEKQRFLKAIRR